MEEKRDSPPPKAAPRAPEVTQASTLAASQEHEVPSEVKAKDRGSKAKVVDTLSV